MSLINEALKRAQHQRKVAEAGYSPPVPGGSGQRITQRGKPMASQTLLLIVAGCVTLIVLTVVSTIYLQRDETKPPEDRTPQPSAISPVVVPTATDSAPTVALSIPPAAASPATAPALVAAPPSASATPPVITVPALAAPVVKPTEASVALAPPVVAALPKAPAKSTPSAAPGSTGPDQQVLVFLDNLRIMGVRFSGIDSKVLISDRVFRVNDIVERNLGLRLVEVQPDRLFFVDARGVAYIKNL